MKSILIAIICSFFYVAATGQNVGIHTSAPTRGKVVVAGAVGSTNTIISSFSANSGVSLQANYPAIGFNQYYTDQNRYINAGKAGILWQNMTNGSLLFDVFNTSGTANNPALSPVRVMTISQNGNVSLNAAEANASLFVGYTASNYITRLQGTTYHSEFNRTQDAQGITIINGGKAGADVYINDQSSGSINIGGTLGVNEDAAGAGTTLHIKQYNRGLVLVEPSTFNNWEFNTTKNLTDPASDFYLYYNGTYKGNFFYVDGSYNPISDARLKKNVKPIQNALDRLLLLKPVQYLMIDNNPNQKKAIGFLAQQVHKVFPETVNIIKEKDMGYPGLDELYTMNYDGLGSVIIAAIQEQQAKIREMEQRNADLKKRIEELKKLKTNKP